MTEQDLLMTPVAEGARYLMQNQGMAFAGDVHLAKEILRLKEKHGIDTVVETGTYIGTTTLWFAKHFDYTVTLETDPHFHAIATKRLAGIDDVNPLLGEGKTMLRVLHEQSNYLIFCDAHPLDASGIGYDVVIQELEAIAESGVKPAVLVLHDFFNPLHPEYQHDKFNGEPFTLQWVGPSLDKIYGVGGWDSHYNDQATGAKVGVLFIERI